MAVASDGAVLVNAHQLAVKDDLAAVVECAEESGLDVFVGVMVPAEMRANVMRNLDDALADVVGRIGERLTGAGKSASASSRSAADSRRARQGPPAAPARRPRGRQT